MQVFIHTSPFEPNFHSASDLVKLPFPTDDSREIVRLARETAMRPYKTGSAYMKAGVGLVELTDRRHHQFDLLHSGQGEKADRLMVILDRISREQGKGSAFIASQGVLAPWNMRQQFKSPGYTTQWDDLSKAHCRE